MINQKLEIAIRKFVVDCFLSKQDRNKSGIIHKDLIDNFSTGKLNLNLTNLCGVENALLMPIVLDELTKIAETLEHQRELNKLN